MSEELALYEGVRRGRAAAFRRLVDLHHGGMDRVAGWYVPDPVGRRRLIRDTWEIALRGLNMFAWHSTFRAWLFGILVSGGRAAGAPPAAPVDVAPGPAQVIVDWTQLPWSPGWTAASWELLEAAVAALPLAQRETLRLHDVEGWPAREVYDVLGWTEAEGGDLLAAARDGVLDVVRRHLGAAPWGPGEEAERLRAARGLAAVLAALQPAEAPPADPELRAVFRAWRAQAVPGAWHVLPVLGGVSRRGPGQP